MTRAQRIPLWIGAGVLAFGVLAWVARPGSSARQPAAAAGSTQLVVDEEQYDFGKVSMAAGKVQKSFTIANEGSDAVTITKLFTSCMCTKATLIAGETRKGPFGMPGHGSAIPSIKVSLAPNETATVEAVFDPAAHGPAGVGRIERTITVETEGRKPLELGFTAEVLP